MKHISDSLLVLPTLISREHILATRVIAICSDFLSIQLQSRNIKVSSNIVVISRVSFAEKAVISREKHTILGYVNDNSYGYLLEDIITR
jgi:hypothetical protein